MKRLKPLLIAGVLVATLCLGFLVPVGPLVGEAEARPGRPATPTSVAGVARRTTRRTIRRSTVYIATLPKSCSRVDIDGTTLHLCSGTYYQSHQGQYVVVHVD